MLNKTNIHINFETSLKIQPLITNGKIYEQNRSYLFKTQVCHEE